MPMLKIFYAVSKIVVIPLDYTNLTRNSYDLDIQFELLHQDLLKPESFLLPTAQNYFADSVKQELKPEEYYFGREIKEREYTAKV